MRTITPAPGVVGPTSETYAYDGLSRLTSTTSGGQTAGFEYDSLSRVVRETQNGRAVESTYDDAGNRAALLYPSGLKVGTHFDELDRLRSVMRMGTSDTPVASYGYRGQDLLAERNVGGLSGRMAFDGARRLTATTYQDLASATAFGETLGWNKRNQLTSQSRADLNDAAKLYQYDPAGRITGALSYQGELPADLTGLDGERFRYDTADNLTEQSKKAFGIDQVTTLPVDPSGRNRPASIHGIPLTWDPNGNLTHKGDLHFEYDYRNRLSRVTRSGQEVATYGYDAFNRRVEKSVDGSTQLTSWSGWQALEKSENGEPTERRIFGNGIDELVQVEKVEGGASLTYAPVYDAKGNLALLTDANGKIVERANTSTYGQTTWSADSTPPTITQLRLRSGTLELRTSEEVRLAALSTALTSGKATLVETGTNHRIQVLATQPSSVTRTRLVLMPSTAIAPGTELRLRLEPESIEDLFGHSLDEPFEQTLTWQPTADTVLADTAPPEVSHVLLRGTSVEVGFNEPLDAAGVAAAILVDGQAQTWTVGSDGEIWTAANLPDSDHTLTIGASPLDLSGKPLAEAFEKLFRIEASHLDQIVYRKPDSSELPTSATGAVLTFQGLELDPETGLLYVRNRYLDPELGRFVTADPLGYPDGPSGYGFGAGDAVNGRDPMGLANATSGVSIPKANPAATEDAKRSLKFLGRMASRANTHLLNIPVYVARIPGATMASLGNLSKHASYFADCLIVHTEECARELLGAIRSTPDYVDSQTRAYLDAPAEEHADAWSDQLTLTALFGLLGSTSEVEATYLGNMRAPRLPLPEPEVSPLPSVPKPGQVPRALSNAEVRAWYNARVRTVDVSGALTRETAERVFAARNALKVEARGMMGDRAAAAELERTDPIRTFEFYVQKYSGQGYSGELLWQRIIQGGRTPNKAVNERFGVD